MKGQLPPSSKVTFFNPSEHNFATSFPTLVYKIINIKVHSQHRNDRPTEPVNVTFLISGWRHKASLKGGVLSRLVVSTLNTPFGNPACSASIARVNTERGVSGDGFTIIQQPAASAAPAFRKIILLNVSKRRLNILVSFTRWENSMEQVRQLHRPAASL